MANQHSLPGPDDITRAVLPNGITVLARSNFNSPSVVVSGSFPVGSLFEPDTKLGLASFVASALMRGTATRSFQEIFDALESVGASLGFTGGTHTSGFGGRALAEDLDLLLEIMSAALRHPSFPVEPVERLRSQILAGLAIRAQDTGEMASLAFDDVVYKDHPYCRPEDGYPETVQAIEIGDLAEFHRAHFGPKGMVIAVVGGIPTEQAVEKIALALGDWENPLQPSPPPLPPARPVEELVRRHVDIPGKSQTDVVLGNIGPVRRSPDYVPASLGNSILGQFGMFGRIGSVVREQSGLAYYAFSSVSGGLGPGPWYISAGVDPANVDRTIDLIRAEIARFVTEPVSEEELQDNKAHYIGRLPLSLESNGGVAGALLNLERFDLGLDFYRRSAGIISAVTREEILETAQRYLHPDRLAVTSAG